MQKKLIPSILSPYLKMAKAMRAIGIVATDNTGKIIYASDEFEERTGFSEKDIAGKQMEDLFVRMNGHGSDGRSTQRIMTNHSRIKEILEGVGYEMAAVAEGVRVIVEEVHRDLEVRVYSIMFNRSGAESEFREYFNELFAFVDEKGNIVEYTLKFYNRIGAVLNGGRVLGANIRDILDENSYAKIEGNRKALERMALESALDMDKGWQALDPAEFMPSKAPFAYTNPDSTWRIAGKDRVTLTELRASRAYALLNRRFDFNSHDVRVCFRPSVNNIRLIMAGTADFITAPEERGYLVGNTSKNTRIRRNIDTVAVMAPAAKGALFCVEKTRVVVRFSIDGKEVLSFADPTPLERGSELPLLGFMSEQPVEISDIKIHVRPNALHGRPLPETKFLVRLKNHPDEFYECEIRPTSHLFLGAQEEAVRLFGLRNITALHKLELKANDYEKEISRLQASLAGSEGLFHGMAGKSAAAKAIAEQVRSLGPTDLTVLITGETGTGKDLAAHALHNESDRKQGPFVHIDCATLPESLIESELFGHEKGAFTGADQRKAGKFEQAERGTVFLDEIGNLNMRVQAKLLRFIQTKELEREGGNQVITADVRLIAATNADLEEMVMKGLFRSDLLYRLKVAEINLPPLRERKEDIYVVADYLIKKICVNNNLPIPVMENEVIPFLGQYHWPGNIRELYNVLSRTIVPSSASSISVQNFPQYLKRILPNPQVQAFGPSDPQFSDRPRDQVKDETATDRKKDYKSKDAFIGAMEFIGRSNESLARYFGVSKATINAYKGKYNLTRPQGVDYADEIHRKMQSKKFTIRDVQKELGISYLTAKKAVHDLIKRNLINREKRGITVWYTVES